MSEPFLTTWDATSRGSPHDRLSAAIDAWIRSPALLDLARADGGEVPVDMSTDVLLDWLLKATTTWDIRRGQERNEAQPDQPLSAARTDQVLTAATTLGLRNPRSPSSQLWDTILVLGGRLGACLSRVAYAIQLADRERRDHGRKAVSHAVVALATRRPLDQSELAVAAELGLDARDEHEVMRQLLADTDTSIGNTDENPPESSRTYADGTVVLTIRPGREAIAVPSPDPNQRADTYDTLTWWARHCAPRPSVFADPSRILVVTSSIYTTYQGLVAVRVLGLRHQLSVETVGVPAAIANQFPDTAVLGPGHYLQEMRATLQAARLVLDEAGGPLRDQRP
jgi:hypothetical protein